MTIVIQLPSGERLNLDRDVVLIGADASCDVRLPKYSQLQPQHARIRKLVNRWFLESQGDWLLKVNDEPAGKSAWLVDGCLIQLTPTGPAVVFQPKPDHKARLVSPTPSAEQPVPTELDVEAKLNMRRTERQALIETTLPHLYQALGESVYLSGRYHDEFPKQCQRIEKLNDQVRKAREQAGDPATSEQEAAQRQRAIERSRSLGTKANAALAELGRVAFDRYGADAGDHDLTLPIAPCREQVAKLDDEIAQLARELPSYVDLWGLIKTGLLLGGLASIIAIIVYFLWF